MHTRQNKIFRLFKCLNSRDDKQFEHGFNQIIHIYVIELAVFETIVCLNKKYYW